MTHEDRGHYAAKHPPDRALNPRIAEAVRGRASQGEVSCAAAHAIATDLMVAPAEVGATIDVLEMRIVKCQLGLYGYRPQKKIVRPAETPSEDLERAIRQALSNGRLSCSSAWEIAAGFGISRMEVSSVCDALGIKIKPCQLGSF